MTNMSKTFMITKEKQKMKNNDEFNRHANDIKQICHSAITFIEGDDYTLGVIGKLKQGFKVLELVELNKELEKKHWDKLISLTKELKKAIYGYTEYMSLLQIRYTSDDSKHKTLDRMLEKHTLQVNNKNDGDGLTDNPIKDMEKILNES